MVIADEIRCPYVIEEMGNLAKSIMWRTYVVLGEIFIRIGNLKIKQNLKNMMLSGRGSRVVKTLLHS